MNLIGHSSQFSFFQKFMADSMNRTFLVVGPRESGKSFFVKHCASVILDKSVFSDLCPDFIYIKSASKYKSVLDDFNKAIFKNPAKHKSLIVFLDDIDVLPDNAITSLLKNIEEPPKKTSIFLSARSQLSVLNTVISRVVKINLNSRSAEEKRNILLLSGVVNFDEKLKYCSSIKSILSPNFELSFSIIKEDINLFFEILNSNDTNRFIFDNFDHLEKVFERLLHNLSAFDVSRDFYLFINKFINFYNSYFNKTLLLFNFIYESVNGFKGIKEKFKA